MLTSPGLVVMGADSCSKGPGFESRRRILDEHFQIYCLFEKTEYNRQERPGMAHFLKNDHQSTRALSSRFQVLV